MSCKTFYFFSFTSFVKVNLRSKEKKKKERDRKTRRIQRFKFLLYEVKAQGNVEIVIAVEASSWLMMLSCAACWTH